MELVALCLELAKFALHIKVWVFGKCMLWLKLTFLYESCLLVMSDFTRKSHFWKVFRKSAENETATKSTHIHVAVWNLCLKIRWLVLWIALYIACKLSCITFSTEHPDGFLYTNQGNSPVVSTIEDADDLMNTRQALSVLGTSITWMNLTV